MRVRLIAITQPIVPEIKDQEQLIEYAGRKCTASLERIGKNTGAFVEARIKQRHSSILEHVQFMFEIDGISRSCLAQLTRHRIASYSVESQRYNGVDFEVLEYPAIFPESINTEEKQTAYDYALLATQNAYKELVALGVPKEDARMILPLATTTNLVMSINLRSVLNLFSLRCDPASQWEIRELANAMKEIVYEYCPSVIYD